MRPCISWDFRQQREREFDKLYPCTEHITWKYTDDDNWGRFRLFYEPPHVWKQNHYYPFVFMKAKTTWHTYSRYDYSLKRRRK